MNAGTASEILAQIRSYAKTAPDTVAIVDNDGKDVYTYREFIGLTDAITFKLRGLGVAPGTVVPIRSGRTYQHMAARLSLLSMGAVPLSLDPLIPDERVGLIVRTIGCKIIIDDSFFPVEPAPEEVQYPDLPDNIPGFIIFTSGSTGTPKGILHPRATVTYFADLIERTRTVWDHCSVCCIVSVSFVPSLFEFVVTLRHGRPIYLASDTLRGDILGMREFINSHKITHLACTTSYLRALGADTTLEDLFVMGERAGAMQKTHYNVFNIYGASEVIMTMGLLQQDREDMTIGEPYPGCSIEIVDDDGNPSDEGELVYRGRGIMLGYLNKIAGKIPSKPLEVYYTGDLARREADGIHIIGRKGDMIKINGQRVEPAEVEFALHTLPGITQAVVKAFFDSGTYMCAYYTSDSGLAPETVRYELAKKVNPYMVPAFISRVDSFPLNNNGKIDRMSLETLRPKIGSGSAPVNEVQAAICSVFARVLNLPEVGIDDFFMKVGGDSVKAIRAQSELANAGIEVDIGDLIVNGTARKLSEIFYDKKGKDMDFGTPVTPMQSMFLNGYSRHGEAFRVVLRAKGAIDGPTLQRAIDSVTDRHTALRASFVTEGGVLKRVVSPRGTRVCMINAASEATPEKPFAVSAARKGGVDYLILSVHRAISDLRTFAIVFGEVARAYVEELTKSTTAVRFGSDFDYWWHSAQCYDSYGQIGESEYWQNIENQLVQCQHVGRPVPFNYMMSQKLPGANVFAANPSEIILAAVLRAYRNIYGVENISTEITSSARWLSIGRSNEVVGNLDASYPAVFTPLGRDDSIEHDMFVVMDILRNVPRAGLGYRMDVDASKAKVPELSYEFMDIYRPESAFLELEDFTATGRPAPVSGINISVAVMGDNIRFMGTYAGVPEIAEKFEAFLGEIKLQIRSIIRRCEDNLEAGRVCCPLTTLQMLRMLVVVGDKMPIDHTVSVTDLNVTAEEAVGIIRKVARFHPCLNTRLVENQSLFWLEYSGEPEIKVVPDQPLDAKLLDPFVVEKALCRFVVIDKGASVTVLGDLHHQISDITSLAIISEDLQKAAAGKFPSKVDLGVVYAYWDEQYQKHLSSPEYVMNFFNEDLEGMMPVSPIKDPQGRVGESGYIRYILTAPRTDLVKFAADNGLTLGSVLTSAFGFVNALFARRQKVSFFFLEHGRHSEESQDALGMYFRILPMAVDCTDRPASEYIRDSMKNMVKAMSLKYASEDDYSYWMKGDYVQFKYQTDMNERSGVSRLLGFMPAASYMSFMVGDLDNSIEVQLKYPPEASPERSELLVRAYDMAINGFLRNRSLSDMEKDINRIIRV